ERRHILWLVLPAEMTVADVEVVVRPEVHIDGRIEVSAVVLHELIDESPRFLIVAQDIVGVPTVHSQVTAAGAKAALQNLDRQLPGSLAGCRGEPKFRLDLSPTTHHARKGTEERHCIISVSRVRRPWASRGGTPRPIRLWPATRRASAAAGTRHSD